MPVCPGCFRSVAYRALPVHLRHCRGVVGDDPAVAARSMERIEREVRVLEDRFDGRVERLERRLSALEGPGGSA